MAEALKPAGVLLLLLLAGTARAAAPQLSGRYASEGLGELELGMRGERLVARHLSGGSCTYAANEDVFSGEWEGQVLVGTVTLCQQGPSCSTRAYPLLAFYNPEDGSLAAHLKLDSGCTSPALQEVLLRVQPVRPGVADSTVLAASAVAARRRPLTKDEERQVQQAYGQATLLMRQGQYGEAVRRWEDGLALNPENWAGHLGLGYALFQLNRVDEAIRAFERARELRPRGEPDVHFNLACAYARRGDRTRALASLQQAVGQGFSDAETMARDADLLRLLGEDMRFKRLVKKAMSQQSGRARRNRGP